MLEKFAGRAQGTNLLRDRGLFVAHRSWTNGIGLILSADDGDDRPEALIPIELHTIGDPIDDGGRHEHSVCLATRDEAAKEGLATRELVASFRRLIERQFRDHTSVLKYAAALCTSEPRLRRACLAITGQTPIELLHLRLLVEAERQLRYTSMPVTQVAYYLGFEDPAYLSRFFSRRMGLSPRAFRVRDGLETQGATRR